MKENNHSLADAVEYVKKRRSCINPNDGFLNQLLIYEGILAAKSEKEKHTYLIRFLLCLF
jgi:protein phosphatase slingshot